MLHFFCIFLINKMTMMVVAAAETLTKAATLLLYNETYDTERKIAPLLLI